MRILMHDNALTERGTTKALETYAHGLTENGYNVDIAFCASNPQNVDDVVRRIGSKYRLLPYESFDEISEIQGVYDVGYFIKSGHRDGKYFRETPSLVHAVFQDYEPHGAGYVYVSEWLAEVTRRAQWKPRHLAAAWRGRREGCLNATKFEAVPHAVDVAPVAPSKRFVKEVDEGNFVILRYGGRGTFDLPWVHDELEQFVAQHKDVVALMVNTEKFSDHPRIRFLPAFTEEEQRDQLLASCDVFLHAQHFGETFGLALVEVMQAQRQVLSWSGGYNKAYLSLLEGSGSLFADRWELRQKLEALRSGEEVVDRFLVARRADQFRSVHVLPQLMRQLESICGTP